MKWVKFLPLFLLCLFASCAGVSQYDTSSSSPSYIEVKNNGWSDIVVYEVVEGTNDKVRVTDVGAFRSARHLLFNMGTSNTYFLIHEIGGQEYVIPFPWAYQLNTRIEMTVENNLALSTFSVFSLDR